MSKNLLNTSTDKYLISLVKKDGNNEAFKEICRRYENIFYKVCQKYFKSLTFSGISPQDIFNEKNYIIFHCITSFNPQKKAKLSTWIGNYARYLCLNSINSRKFILPTTDEEVMKRIEETQISQDYFNKFNPEEYKYILNIISQLRDKRVEEVFKYRYFNDKKMIWAKIAKKMKVSTQTVINLHTKGISILRKKVKSPTISDVI